MSLLSDAQLLAYLDGEADPRIAAQIQQSETYLVRLQELKKMNDILRAKLYRVDCPDALELGEYQLGVLPRRRISAVEKHLSFCPLCAHELEQLVNFMKPGLVERAKVVLAELISGGASTGPLSLTPAFGQRGGRNGPLIYEADNVKIAIDIQGDAKHIGRQALIGLITGLHAEDYVVSLWRDGKELSNTNVDDLGNFTISNLEQGEYELFIKGPKVEIHIQTFTI